MNESLFNAIFHRKSVRSFTDESLSNETLAQVIDYAQGVAPLYPDIKIDFAIENDLPIGLFAVKAPHYLCLYTEKGEGPEHLVNAGYVLQNVDLYLHTRGLGSCWLGVAKPKVRRIDDRKFLIMLAFGKPQGALGRSDLDEFKRKPLDQISSGDDPRLEAARLAPSATNAQNWFFEAVGDNINVYATKLTGAKKRLYGNLTIIDGGIALCHLMLASKHFDLPFNYQVLPVGAVPKKEGHEYLATI